MIYVIGENIKYYVWEFYFEGNFFFKYWCILFDYDINFFFGYK